MKIFVLEDETFLRNYICKFLVMKGYNVESYEDAESFLKHAAPMQNDCLVLDINLPGKSGFETLSILNERFQELHVIFISAITEVAEIAKAFKAGAHDYLKKPFELEELAIRITNLVKGFEPQGNEIPVCGHIVYNKQHDCFTQNGQDLMLTRVQFRLLKEFVTNPDRLLTFDYLLNTIWWEKSVSHATLSAHVNALKKQLPALQITNVRGSGYIMHRNRGHLD
ncbi:MAG: response regulator transcription factor [Sulfurimonadaceae bacterium]|nr:response regulator transcription factor [Sulfurimonadaceae bacterium]